MKKPSYTDLQKKISQLEKELKLAISELNQNKRILIQSDDSDKKIVKYIQLTEAYRKEKEFAESIVNTAQAIILVLDKQAKIVSINPFMEKLSGYKASEVVGKDWFTTFLPKRDWSKIKQVFVQAIDNIKIYGHVNPIVTKEGKEKNIEWYNKTLKDKNENVIGVLSIGYDITERILIEKQNSYLKEVLLAIRNINKLITKEKNIKNLIQGACNCLTETRGFYYAWITLFDKNKDIVLTAESISGKQYNNIHKNYTKENLPMCIEKALSHHKVLVSNLFSEECRQCTYKILDTNCSVMTTRIQHKDQLYGTLSVTLQNDFIVNEEEESLFQEVAEDIALSIYNIQLAEKRAQIETALRESELKFKTIFNTTNDGICIFNKESELVEINQAACDFFDQSREEILKIPFLNFIHPISIEKFEEFTQAILTGNEIATEIKGIHKDNSVIEIEIYGTGIEINNEHYIFSTLRNISAERKTQIALRNSEERFRLLAENASDLIYRMTLPDGLYDYLSPSCEEILGYSPQEFYNNPLLINEIIHPDWQDYYNLQWEKIIKGELSPYYEYQIVHKSGKIKWLQQRNSFITDNIGKTIAIEGIVHDITERKKAEEAIIRSEKKYRKFVDNTVVGVFISKIGGELLFTNDALAKMFEYGSDKEFLKEGGIKKYKNPKDRDRFIKELKKKGSITNYEVEVLTKNDKSIFVNINAVLDGDEISGMVLDVTKKINAEMQLLKLNSQLQDNIEKYADLFNATGTATCIYNDNNLITMCNSKFEELSGYTREEIEGKKIWHEFVKKEDLERMKEYHKQRTEKKGNPPSNYDFTFIDRKGKHKEIHLQIGLNKNTNERIASLIDITVRKKTEQALIESENRFRTYIESSPTSIFIINEKGKFKFANKSLSHLLKYPLNELLNFSLVKIIHDDDAIEKKENIPNLLKLNSFNEEFVFKTKKGNKVDVILDAAKLSGNEILVYCTDISKLKDIEKAHIYAKEKAEESDRLKSAFLANMSHEIRTPMNGILGFAQMLRKKTIPEELKESYIDIINAKGNQLLQLITDIIDVSKIEADQIKIVNKIFSLNSMLRELEVFSYRLIKIENKNIKLKLNIPLKDEESLIISDHLRIEQILTNLLSNAFKFTKKGEVEYGYSLKDNILQFYVKDSGIGLSQKDQEIIFQRFVQSTKDEDDLSRGTGLGLAISKGLVEKLGGKIWVESKPGKGAIFFFTIPYKSGKTKESSSGIKEEKEYDWSEKTILVAEDEDVNFQLIEAILEPTKASIIRAKTGFEVIDKSKKVKKIDAILMDIKMPGMNGLNATKEIRKTRKTIPIVAQTAYAMSVDEEECLSSGCDAFISKPLDPVTLLDILYKFLKD